MKDDFCVFILSHGRADKVVTLKTLQEYGYYGDWYLVIDDEDPQRRKYQKKYGEHVKVFNKDEISKTFDTCDNFKEKNTVVFARNACWQLANELGYKYFLELDDDYYSFEHRYSHKGKLLFSYCQGKLNAIFNIFIEFLKTTKATSIAFAQGGDFIGGANNKLVENPFSRKIMNSFFCSTEKPFKFIGKINEDVNTYCLLGSQGVLFFTNAFISLKQGTTQMNKGGMSDIYLDRGTYVKSFYSVMLCPSFVSIATIRDKHIRIHHRINWDAAVPKILSPKWKKV